MKKCIFLVLILIAGVSFAADEKSAVKELDKLSSENNSTEKQFSKSKSDKNWGNNQYSSGDRLVCESYRGQRQHCRADTSGGVRLVKQIGYNTCQGNWGYDYYGVWVANGCRGEFQIDRYQNHYGQTDDVIRCESYSYRRQTCASNLQGAEVQLIHQLSNRNCSGNWGFNQNEIWVTNGCKADFRISRNNYNNPYNSGIHDGLVECRATGTSIEHCQVPELQSIELIQERGGSYRNSCRGNWGYSSHGIWVRNGCDAQFRVVEYQQPNNSNNQNNHNNQGREVVNHPPVNRPPITVKCKSRRNNLKICNTKGPFKDVQLKREISAGKYPCEGNWGVNQQGQLFVSNNCYAEFKVYR